MPVEPALRARVAEFQLESIRKLNAQLVSLLALRNVLVRQLPKAGDPGYTQFPRGPHFLDIHWCWARLRTLPNTVQVEWESYLAWLRVAPVRATSSTGSNCLGSGRMLDSGPEVMRKPMTLSE